MRKTTFAIDEYYHIYNRGVDKRAIFNNDSDRYRFLKLLYLCNSDKPFHFKDLVPGEEFYYEKGEKLVDIITYCLMDNHFHLILRETTEKGISTFMHKLGVSYTMYFNKVNDRKGVLFENNFNDRHLDTDEYLKYVFAYIHLNPIKIIDANWKKNGISDLKKAQDFINRYQFSSYPDYLGSNRKESCIINPKSLPEYFKNKKEVTDYLNDWLTSPRDEVSG